MNTAEKLTLPGPGIYSDIPAEAYHAMTDYVSKSYLKKLDKCPAAARVPQEDTPAMAFGRASHVYLLEGPEMFFQECAVLPSGINKRTTAGKEEWAQFEAANQGKTLVSGDDFLKLVEMKKALNAHPFASKLLAEGVSEQSVFWQDAEINILMKCRPDRIPDGGKGVLVDLKTCACAGEYEFCRDVVKYGYAMQAAIYLDGLNAVTGNEYDAFCFIALCKEPPYQTEVYILDAVFIQYGRDEYKRLLRIEAECRRTGIYPNYNNSGVSTLCKPGYL
jgi:hypothetical protein